MDLNPYQTRMSQRGLQQGKGQKHLVGGRLSLFHWAWKIILVYKLNRKEKKRNETKQNKTKQNKTKQNKTKQNKTKQNKTKQNKTKQNKRKQKEKRKRKKEETGEHKLLILHTISVTQTCWQLLRLQFPPGPRVLSAKRSIKKRREKRKDEQDARAKERVEPLISVGTGFGLAHTERQTSAG